jgi:hypothetical protein
MREIQCSTNEVWKDRPCEGKVRFYRSEFSEYVSRCRSCREDFKFEDLEEVTREEYEAIYAISQ